MLLLLLSIVISLLFGKLVGLLLFGIVVSLLVSKLVELL